MIFTKLKHRIETWLKRLIASVLADEVSKLNLDLSNERASFCCTINDCDVQLHGVLERLNELAYFKENAELRATIKELVGHTAKFTAAFYKLHPELVKK